MTVEQIRERIDLTQFFEEMLGTLKGSGPERMAHCPFHEDETESLSVNVVKGLYRCHGCREGGDFLAMFMKLRDLKFGEAVRELGKRLGIEQEPEEPEGPKVVAEAIIENAAERLMATDSLVAWMSDQRGISAATLRAYQIGHDGQRYYIPIRDELGTCVNVRKYNPAGDGAGKMRSWRAGYGEARLWPMDSLMTRRDEPLYVFEGEMDALLALQHGLCAVTCTGGAGTWKDQWNILFRGRDVIVCYDVDEAGVAGAEQAARGIGTEATSVRIVALPLTEPRGADFTDYVHGHGYSVEDFKALPVREMEMAAPDEPAEAVSLHLSQASRAEYHNRQVRLPVVVSGKTTAPFIVPQRVRFHCGMPGAKICTFCPVAAMGGDMTRAIDYETNEVLQLVGVTDAQVHKKLKESVGIPARCTYVEYDYKDSVNVEEVRLIPEVARSDEEAPYVTRVAYYVGHGLEANRGYVMTGLTVPDPKTQMATHLIHDAVPSRSNLDSFRVTPEVVEDLRVFAADGDLWKKTDKVYDDLERHTRIYERRDLMLATDLVYHSVIAFEFQGQPVKRGWTEALVIGDSRTGKSTVVEKMLDWYGAGEVSSGENTSLAGLVGGLQQIGTSWSLQWGKIPLNDRRLLVIDEAGNLAPESIAKMSSMRSSGQAEIVKIHTEKTNSRTRMIWISNPRENLPLSSFSQGVTAVKTLIGAPEDLARFDLVVTAASGDVSLEVVNATRGSEVPEVFTSHLCHQRVMWAWSRTSEQVQFTPDAEARVLMRAMEQGARYRHCTKIPLVEPNEQRIKLARLAVAAAAMFMSSDDGETIIVKPEHVDFVFTFLERLYAKPSLAFTEWADAQRRRNELTSDVYVVELMEEHPHAERAIMEDERFTQTDLREMFEVDDRDELREMCSELLKTGFLVKESGRYAKTPAAIRWLRERIGNGNSMGGQLSIDEPPPF